MSPIILVIAGISLLGLGLGLGYWFARSQSSREATRADDIQKELDTYRQHVTEHFGETAQQFQEIGKQYQSLYKHMAQGASALCDPAQSDNLIGFAAGNAPTLVASDEQPENPPEVIKDYAATEEIEPAEVIRDFATAEEVEVEPPHVEVATPVELSENSSAPDVTAAEPAVDKDISAVDKDGPVVDKDIPAVDKDIGDQVAAPTDVEKERTVH